MSKPRGLIPSERIKRGILVLRGEKVMLDADLAELYGVTTKALNQAVKRNSGRVPDDFVFRLTKAEMAEVVTNCDHLQWIKCPPHLPYVFTEYDALMLANVLNSERAAQTSMEIVRVFIRLRQMLSSNTELARKLAALEKKYDAQFKVVFDAIRQLMSPPAGPVARSASTPTADEPLARCPAQSRRGGGFLRGHQRY